MNGFNNTIFAVIRCVQFYAADVRCPRLLLLWLDCARNRFREVSERHQSSPRKKVLFVVLVCERLLCFNEQKFEFIG